jgi:ribose/xylose/arabinose/galactoside ABC-type transport system permease subunit
MLLNEEQPPTAAQTPRLAAFSGIFLTALRLASVYVALLVIGIGLSFVSPYFLTVSNLMNVLLQAATVSIVAAGLTVVLIAGEIDLSIGSLIGMTGSVAAVLIIKSGYPVGLGILAGLLAGMLAGLLNGLATVVFRIPSFIVTLAMLGIAQGSGLLLTNGRPVSGFPPLYSVIGQGQLASVPVPVLIAVLVYVIIHLALTHTKFGVEVYATGGGRRAAEMAGIRVNRIIIWVFAISGTCGAIAGIVLSSRLDAGNGNFGANNLLDAVAGAVVGGTSLMGGAGSVVGTLGGILIISFIRNGLILVNVQAFWQEVAVGLIIVLAVVINQIARGEFRVASIRRTLNR